MGLYDRIIPKPDIKCPICKSKLDFQTKDLDCMLDTYYEGKSSHKDYKIKINKNPKGGPILVPDKSKPFIFKYPQYRRFYAYAWCSICAKAIGHWFEFTEKCKLIRFKTPVIEKEY